MPAAQQSDKPKHTQNDGQHARDYSRGKPSYCAWMHVWRSTPPKRDASSPHLGSLHGTEDRNIKGLVPKYRSSKIGCKPHSGTGFPGRRIIGLEFRATRRTGVGLGTIEHPARKGRMLPQYLIPECHVGADGIGPPIEIIEHRGNLLVLTLGISGIVQGEGMIVSVHGSSDQLEWGTEPLVSFSQKYYCGLYSVLLSLTKYPDVQYLRAQWRIQFWAKTETTTPMLEFYLLADVSGSRVSGATPRRLAAVIAKPVQPENYPHPSKSATLVKKATAS